MVEFLRTISSFIHVLKREGFCVFTSSIKLHIRTSTLYSGSGFGTKIFFDVLFAAVMGVA